MFPLAFFVAIGTRTSAGIYCISKKNYEAGLSSQQITRLLGNLVLTSESSKQLAQQLGYCQNQLADTITELAFSRSETFEKSKELTQAMFAVEFILECTEMVSKSVGDIYLW